MLLLPDPMNPLDVHSPPAEHIRTSQNLMRPFAPIPRERLNDLPHHGKQFTVAVNLPGTVPLRASVLTEHLADPSFRGLLMPQGPPDGFHRPTATLGATQFGRAASFKISMSKAWSATSLFSLVFSFWSS